MPAPRRIDRARIVDAALEIIDADGLDALTMRRVALALDVEAMSLYNHVPNKDALLDAVLGRLLASVPLPKRSAPWPDQIRSMATSARKVARAHPHAFRLAGSRPIRSPDALPLLDRLYGEVARAGLEGAAVNEACELVIGVVLGLIQLEINGFFAMASGDTVGGSPEAAAFPHVVAAHAAGKTHDANRFFRQGLDLVVLGVERIAARERGEAGG